MQLVTFTTVWEHQGSFHIKFSDYIKDYHGDAGLFPCSDSGMPSSSPGDWGIGGMFCSVYEHQNYSDCRSRLRLKEIKYTANRWLKTLKCSRRLSYHACTRGDSCLVNVITVENLLDCAIFSFALVGNHHFLNRCMSNHNVSTENLHIMWEVQHKISSPLFQTSSGTLVDFLIPPTSNIVVTYTNSRIHSFWSSKTIKANPTSTDTNRKAILRSLQ